MRKLPSQLWKWDAVDIAAGIRAGAISARETTQSVLDRIAEVNPKINNLSHVLEEEEPAATDAADPDLRAGQPIGVLHGVPVTTTLNADQPG